MPTGSSSSRYTSGYKSQMVGSLVKSGLSKQEAQKAVESYASKPFSGVATSSGGGQPSSTQVVYKENPIASITGSGGSYTGSGATYGLTFAGGQKLIVSPQQVSMQQQQAQQDLMQQNVATQREALQRDQNYALATKRPELALTSSGGVSYGFEGEIMSGQPGFESTTGLKSVFLTTTNTKGEIVEKDLVYNADRFNVAINSSSGELSPFLKGSSPSKGLTWIGPTTSTVTESDGNTITTEKWERLYGQGVSGKEMYQNYLGMSRGEQFLADFTTGISHPIAALGIMGKALFDKESAAQSAERLTTESLTSAWDITGTKLKPVWEQPFVQNLATTTATGAIGGAAFKYATGLVAEGLLATGLGTSTSAIIGTGYVASALTGGAFATVAMPAAEQAIGLQFASTEGDTFNYYRSQGFTKSESATMAAESALGLGLGYFGAFKGMEAVSKPLIYFGAVNVPQETGGVITRAARGVIYDLSDLGIQKAGFIRGSFLTETGAYTKSWGMPSSGLGGVTYPSEYFQFTLSKPIERQFAAEYFKSNPFATESSYLNLQIKTSNIGLGKSSPGFQPGTSTLDIYTRGGQVDVGTAKLIQKDIEGLSMKFGGKYGGISGSKIYSKMIQGGEDLINAAQSDIDFAGSTQLFGKIYSPSEAAGLVYKRLQVGGYNPIQKEGQIFLPNNLVKPYFEAVEPKLSSNPFGFKSQKNLQIGGAKYVGLQEFNLENTIRTLSTNKYGQFFVAPENQKALSRGILMKYELAGKFGSKADWGNIGQLRSTEIAKFGLGAYNKGISISAMPSTSSSSLGSFFPSSMRLTSFSLTPSSMSNIINNYNYKSSTSASKSLSMSFSKSMSSLSSSSSSSSLSRSLSSSSSSSSLSKSLSSSSSSLSRSLSSSSSSSSASSLGLTGFPEFPSLGGYADRTRKKRGKKSGFDIAPSFTGIIKNIKMTSPVKMSAKWGVTPFQTRGILSGKARKGSYFKLTDL